MTRPLPRRMYPHADGDISQSTEIGGAELADTFTSVMWSPGLRNLHQSPPFALTPGLDVEGAVAEVPEPNDVLEVPEPNNVLEVQ